MGVVTTFVYELMSIANEPPWRYSDPFRIKLRIHTKLVDTTRQDPESVAIDGTGDPPMPPYPFVPPGHSYPDNLPPGHPGEAYPGMPDWPVVHPGDWGEDWYKYPGILDDWPPSYENEDG